MKADTERILNGEEPTKESESKNYIGRDYSGSDSGIARFGEWVANNEKRIEGAKSLPYFLSDNKGLIKGAAPTQTTVTDDGKYRIKDFDGRGSLTIKTSAKEKTVSVSTPQSENNGDEMTQQTWEHTKAKLKDMGWSCSDSDADIYDMESAWDKLGYGRFDFEKLDKDITAIFGDLGLENLSKMFYWDAEQGTARVWIQSLWDEATVVRDFTFKDGKISVHHSLFELAENLQGKGTSKKVLNAFYDQYLRLGVTDIDVFANIDVGGYTWCRYGFCAKQKEVLELLSDIKKSHSELYSEWAQMAEIVSDFYDKHDSSALFPMNLLTDVPNAKNMLKGKSWHGFLDLTDTVQRKIFEEYLGR